MSDKTKLTESAKASSVQRMVRPLSSKEIRAILDEIAIDEKGQEMVSPPDIHRPTVGLWSLVIKKGRGRTSKLECIWSGYQLPRVVCRLYQT